MACRTVLATKRRRVYRTRGSSVTLVGRCHFSCYTQQAKIVDVIYPNALAETSRGGVYTCQIHVKTNNHRHFKTLSLILIFFSFACNNVKCNGTLRGCAVLLDYCFRWFQCSPRHKSQTVLSLCRYSRPSFVY